MTDGVALLPALPFSCSLCGCGGVVAAKSWISGGAECDHAFITRVGGDVSPVPVGVLMKRGL